MSYTFNKRPFWIPGTPVGIVIGDYVLRMLSQPGIYASVTTIDDLTAAKRRGGTTASNVANRSVWTAPRSATEQLIAFSEAAPPGSSRALFLGEWLASFPGFDWGGIGAYTPEDYLTHDLLGRIPSNQQSVVGFKYGLRQGEVFSNTQPYWFYGQYEAAPVQNPGTTDDKTKVLEANLALASRKMGGRYFSDRVSSVGAPAKLGEITLAARPSTQEAGATELIMDPRSFLRSNRSYIEVRGLRARTKMYGASYDMPYGNAGTNYIGGFEVFRDYGSSDESALASSLRSQLGLTGSFGNGVYELVPVDGATMLKGPPVIGVHRAIKVMSVEKNSPDKAVWLYAEFTKDQVAATLTAQKAVSDDATKASIDAAVASVGSMASGSTFRVFYAPAGVGPFDIYDSVQIATSIADGAEVSDIDASPVGSTTLGSLRQSARTRSASKIISWWEQPQSDNLRRANIGPKTTAPYYVVANAGPPGGVAVYEAAAVTGARSANAGAQGLYADDSALIRAIEADTGVSLLNAAGVKKVGQTQATALLSPWDDLPGAWLRYCASPGWTPIANALMAAVLEPKALFTA